MKRHVSYRLTADALAGLDAFAKLNGLSHTAALELLLINELRCTRGLEKRTERTVK